MRLSATTGTIGPVSGGRRRSFPPRSVAKFGPGAICPGPRPDLDFSCLGGRQRRRRDLFSQRLFSKHTSFVSETVSSETLSPPVDLQRVRTCLSELCASPGEFDQFFSDVFDQLDVLSGQLLRRQQAWQQERGAMEAEERRRSEQWAQRQAELATQTSAVEAADDQSRQQALEQIQQERAHLSSVREVTEQQAQELAQATAELGQTRQELQALLETVREGAAAAAVGAEALGPQVEQIQQERARLSSVREATERQAQELAQATAELGQTRQEFQELLGSVRAGSPAAASEEAFTPQLVELQQERARLEAELEMVRDRAAEMSEMLAQQKREMAQERSQWTEELKRMRHLLETHSAGAVAPVREVPSAPVVAESHPAPKAPVPESDPVLDSVMAQFEMLQKDLARRRKQQTPTAG